MKRIFTRLVPMLLCIGFFVSPTYAIVPPSAVAPASLDPDPVTVKSAIAEFRNLSRAEKKARMQEVKKALREFKADKRAHRAAEASTVLQVICAILIPPLGVYLHEGVINTKFWIDLVLTLLFFIPGMVYALIVVLGG